MSMSATFDTHAFIKQLIATGFTEEQAETQVRLLSEILDNQLSTKADLSKVDAHVLELKLDIKALEYQIREIDQKTSKIEEQIKPFEQQIRLVEQQTKSLEQQVKELDNKFETKFKEMDNKFETKFKELDNKFETRFKEMDIKFETKFKEMDIKFSRDMRELELRMVIKLGALTLGGIGLLFGLMRAWPMPVQYIPPPGQELRYTPPVAQPTTPYRPEPSQPSVK